MTSNEIILKYNSNGVIPVDAIRIVKDMGFNVLYYKEVTSEFGRYDKASKTISINENLEQRSQNFICAHMLYHMLDKDGPNTQIELRSIFSNSSNTKEVQANIFAGELLMPKLYVKILVLKRRITSPLKLAEIFNVSESAIVYRLERLGAFDSYSNFYN